MMCVVQRSVHRRQFAIDQLLGHAAEVGSPETLRVRAGAPFQNCAGCARVVAAAVQHPHIFDLLIVAPHPQLASPLRVLQDPGERGRKSDAVLP